MDEMQSENMQVFDDLGFSHEWETSWDLSSAKYCLTQDMYGRENHHPERDTNEDVVKSHLLFLGRRICVS